MAASACIAADDVEALLGNWKRLNEVLMDLPLSGVRQLLQAEMDGKRRLSYLVRMYGRYNLLRQRLEMAELLKGTTPWEAKIQ